jgi:hypothetical protein
MVGLRGGVEEGGAEPIDSSRACAERQGADQLPVQRSCRLHFQKTSNRFPPQIHSLFNEVAETLMEQLPALLGELVRLAAREELVEHWIQPLRHGTNQTDQRFGIHRVELVSTGGAPEGVVTAPLPELNPIWELCLETHLLAGQDHCFASIEVKCLDGQQE